MPASSMARGPEPEMGADPARQVARGTARLLSCVLAAKALDFCFYLFLARHLGVAPFGLYTLALSFTLLFSVLADFGLGAILGRDVTRAPERARSLVIATIRIKLGLAALTLAATLGISFFTKAPPGVTVLVALFTAGMLVNSTAMLFQAVLKSAARAGAAGLAVLAQSATALACGAGLVALGVGPLGGAVAYLAASLVHVGVGAYQARGLLPKSPRSGRDGGDAGRLDPGRLDPRHGLALLRKAAPLALSGIFIAVYFRIGAVILHAVQGKEAVGLYGSVYRLFETFAPLSAAYYSVLFPALVRAADGPAGALGRLLRPHLRLISLLSIGLAAFVSLAARPIIALVLGREYLRAAPALSILAWAVPPALLAGLLYYALIAAGRQGRGTAATGVTAVANITLNLILIPRFSYVGAAAATAASEILSFSLLYWILRDRGIGLAAVLWRPLLAGAALAATLAAAIPRLPAGLPGLASAAVLALLVYGLLLFALRAAGPVDLRRLGGIIASPSRRLPPPVILAREPGGAGDSGIREREAA